MSRDAHLARILAMQCLCHHDVHGGAIEEVLAGLAAEARTTGRTRARARGLCTRYLDDREGIDSALARSAEHWDLDRMNPVDRNVIRIALAELCEGRTPPNVVFNEAIEIGREYGSAESPAFINGVLEGAWKHLQGQG